MDYDFRALVETGFGDLLPELPDSTPEEIRAVATGFAKNMNRGRAMVEYLPLLATTVGIQERARGYAEYKIAGEVRFAEPFAPYSTEVEARINKRWGDELANFDSRIKERWDAGGSKIVFDSGILRIERAIGSGKWPIIYSMLEFLFQSQLVATWTAFETLAGDLWVAALNAHPRGLHRLETSKRNRIKNRAKGRNAPFSATEPSTVIEPRAISSLIEKYNFDLSRHMGTILRSAVSLDSLDGIRDAYSMAFKAKAGKIDDALSNPVLDELAAVRNVIVHRGAVADAKHEGQSKGFQYMPHAESGAPIELSGGGVATLIRVVVKCSVDLVVAVNDWIANHP